VPAIYYITLNKHLYNKMTCFTGHQSCIRVPEQIICLFYLVTWCLEAVSLQHWGM